MNIEKYLEYFAYNFHSMQNNSEEQAKFICQTANILRNPEAYVAELMEKTSYSHKWHTMLYGIGVEDELRRMGVSNKELYAYHDIPYYEVSN